MKARGLGMLDSLLATAWISPSMMMFLSSNLPHWSFQTVR